MPVPATAGVVAAVDLLVAAGCPPTDALLVVYRMVYAELVGQRGAMLTTEAALTGLDVELSGTGADILPRLAELLSVPDGREAHDEDSVALGALHQAVLERGSARKRSGSYFTPAPLIAWLLERTLVPALEEAADPATVRVLDPACGSGFFLVAAFRKLVAHGVPADIAVTSCLTGVDTDPAAVELARLSLWLELVGSGGRPAMPALDLHVGDALLDDRTPDRYDVVVGNPPFLNRLETQTALDRATARMLAARANGSLRPYTDVSAVFLHRAPEWAKDGGRIGLVQPQSFLAARDASGIRASLMGCCSLEHLWASPQPVFDANVLTCAPVLRKGGTQGAVRRSHGPTFEEASPLPVDPGQLHGEWSFLVAEALGIPPVRLARAHGVVSDLATCTADFRDQYYGLAAYVHELAGCPHGAPLVTAGLVEPAECRWGRTPTRFQKRRWAAPVVDVAQMRGELARWAEARLVPKLIVATQGRVVEAVVDEAGSWLPSVPTITVAAPREVLWHLLAVLLAPPISAHAAATYAGTALTMRAIKLSARQVGQLPLPGDREAWEYGATLAELAQRDEDRRAGHLGELGRVMCQAYSADTVVLDWWSERRLGKARG